MIMLRFKCSLVGAFFFSNIRAITIIWVFIKNLSIKLEIALIQKLFQ